MSEEREQESQERVVSEAAKADRDHVHRCSRVHASGTEERIALPVPTRRAEKTG